jgi:hypothetical protein
VRLLREICSLGYSTGLIFRAARLVNLLTRALAWFHHRPEGHIGS